MLLWALLGWSAAGLVSVVTLVALAAGGQKTALELMSFGGKAIPATATIFACGVVCEIFAAHPRGLAARRVNGVALALLVVAAPPVWVPADSTASIAGVARGIATTMLLYAWVISVFRSGSERSTPRLFAVAVVATVPFGLAASVLVALFADVQLYDTYFGVGLFHLEMDVVLLAFLGGMHLWRPQLTGRAETGRAEWIGPGLLWAGIVLTSVAQLVLGYEGMPRRYFTYLPEYEGLRVTASIGAGLQALALVWIAVRLARSPHQDEALANSAG